MARKNMIAITLNKDELRKLQLVQLEILEEFDKICRKNNIKYSLDGGTLLGAVRHKGFIPWDDDIDVIMLRSEYERFFEACKTDLDTNRFFLQESRTDKYCNVGFSRIRRKNSIYSRLGHEHMKYQRGVFIDLFALDNVPDNKIRRVINSSCCFTLRKMLWAESAKKIHENFLLRIWYFLLSLVPREIIFSLLDALKNRNNKKDTKLVAHLTYPYNKRCKYGIPRSFLGDFTELSFEGKSFMAIAEYDQYLRMLYDDYMKLPPKDKQKPHFKLSEFKAPLEFNK